MTQEERNSLAVSIIKETANYLCGNIDIEIEGGYLYVFDKAGRSEFFDTSLFNSLGIFSTFLTLRDGQIKLIIR